MAPWLGAAGGIRRRLWRSAGAAAGAWSTSRLTLAPAWPLAQATAAALLAAVIARMVGDHPDPFFAPAAAVVALNAPRGERGLQAIRLVSGVVLGIAVAELAVFALGPGMMTLTAAIFIAMAIARAFGSGRIVVVQAGVSAIITVAVADGEAGFDRLLDASIGAGVALFFSQVLFSPEPVALLRRAESVALSGLAAGMRRTASALSANDTDAGTQALRALRALRDDLSELARLRRASPRIARHSAMWQAQAAPAVRESEHADQLDLLNGACILLARAALAGDASTRAWIAPRIDALGEALATMAPDPASRDARQLVTPDVPPVPAVAGVVYIAQVVAFDIMVFAGASEAESVDAILAISGEFQVAERSPSRRLPFRLDNWREWGGPWRRSGDLSGEVPHRKAADGDVGAKE
jgi:hypothetical protein